MTDQTREPETADTGSELPVPAIESDAVVEVARKAEQRIAAINKIKTIALKVTNANDWVDEAGKPYLQVSGAEKVARLFGISWRIGEPTLDVKPDGHYMFSFKGTFTIAGASIEAIGTRSSTDAFFGRRPKRDEKGKPIYEDGKAVKEDTPVDQIDKAAVMKGAYTNCIGNGVTRLLGIRNLTWEEVGEDRRSGRRVDFNGRNEASGDYTKKRTEIERMCRELFDAAFQLPDESSFEKPEDVLLALTKSEKWRGWNRFDKVTPKSVNITYKQVKDAYTAYMKQIGHDETGQENLPI